MKPSSQKAEIFFANGGMIASEISYVRFILDLFLDLLIPRFIVFEFIPRFIVFEFIPRFIVFEFIPRFIVFEFIPRFIVFEFIPRFIVFEFIPRFIVFEFIPRFIVFEFIPRFGFQIREFQIPRFIVALRFVASEIYCF